MPLQSRVERVILKTENEFRGIRDQALRRPSLVQRGRFLGQEQGHVETGRGGIINKQQDIRKFFVHFLLSSGIIHSLLKHFVEVSQSFHHSFSDGEQDVPTRKDGPRSQQDHEQTERQIRHYETENADSVGSISRQFAATFGFHVSVRESIRKLTPLVFEKNKKLLLY